MLFTKTFFCLAVASLALGTSTKAAAPIPTQMPKIVFDGAHNNSKVPSRRLADSRRVQSRPVVVASWYGPGFHNRRTANGETFNAYGLSAAHRSIPMGTRVKVTNLRNGRSVILRINDYGPDVSTGRSIDLSQGAASRLGMISSGIAPVTIERIR